MSYIVSAIYHTAILRPIVQEKMSFEWRTIVVAGNRVHSQLLLPRGYRKDKHGDRMYTKQGDPMLEYLSFDAAQAMPTVDWATKSDVLAKSEKNTKDVFNELKTLLRNCRKAAVVYHPGGASDPLCQCPYNHYHLVIARDCSKDFEREYRWRKIRQFCKKDKSPGAVTLNVSSQKIKDLYAFIRYLSAKPRQWYGTNSKLLATMKAAIVEKGEQCTTGSAEWVEDEPIEAVIGEDVGAVSEELGFAPIELPVDEDWSEGKCIKKRKADEYSDDEEPFPGYTRPPTKKKLGFADDDEEDDIGFRRGKSIPLARLINILLYLMKLAGTSDKEELRLRIDRMVLAGHPRGPDMERRIRDCNYHRSNGHIYASAAYEYRAHVKKMTFTQLLLSAWNSAPGIANVIDFETSLDLWLDWLVHYGINLRTFADRLWNVLNGDNGKINSIFLYGRSNSGKTMMFSRPLEYIMQDVGNIVQLNAANAFIFEGCVGRRLISIEECEVPASHVEELKKIMGGEKCQVNVKYAKEGGCILPTPVIATSNQDIGTFVPLHREALLNRCYHYELTTPFSPLEAHQGAVLDPRVYVLVLYLHGFKKGQYNFMEDSHILKALCEELDVMAADYMEDPESMRDIREHQQPCDPSYGPVDDTAWHKGIVAYYNNIVVYDPGYLYKKQFEEYFPGRSYHDIVIEELPIVVGRLRILARYRHVIFGYCIDKGTVIPSAQSQEAFCNVCTFAHRVADGSFEGRLFQFAFNELHVDGAGSAGEERLPDSCISGDVVSRPRITWIQPYWQSSDAIEEGDWQDDDDSPPTTDIKRPEPPYTVTSHENYDRLTFPNGRIEDIHYDNYFVDYFPHKGYSSYETTHL